jgi:Family of unknown function (DUF6526)
MEEQNLANHTKLVPAFHFYTLGILVINIGWSIWRWYKAGFSIDAFESILVAIALFLVAFYARVFATKVQDRVIRLEERLRCERLLPAELRPRIAEFSADQLVAMRFASDAELAALARKVLDDKLTSRKQIKQQIKTWRPDYHRA